MNQPKSKTKEQSLIWFSRYGPSSTGGVEYVLQTFVEHATIKVIVCMSSSFRIFPKIYDYQGARVIETENLGRLGRFDLNFSVFLLGIILPFLYKSHLVIFNLPFVQLMPLMILKCRRFLFFIHGLSSSGRFGALHARLLRWLVPNNRVIVTSADTARNFQGARSIDVLPLTLMLEDESRLLDIESPCEDYFLYIGRYAAYKGIDVLVAAAAQCEGEVRVVLIGPGTEEVNKLKVPGLVGMGFVSRTEKESLLARCRGIVLPSIGDGEGFGLVQLEAMAAGKSAIVSELETGIHKVCGDYAWVVTPRDIQELAISLTNYIPPDPGALKTFYSSKYGSKSFKKRLQAVLFR